MRFLLDHDVYAATERFLRALHHDVITAASIGHFQASDEEVLHIAQHRDRILVTRDRDFGSLVFVRRMVVGVVYLRILPSTLHLGHQEVQKVLDSYSEEELSRAFVVIEPGRHRLRRLPV